MLMVQDKMDKGNTQIKQLLLLTCSRLRSVFVHATTLQTTTQKLIHHPKH